MIDSREKSRHQGRPVRLFLFKGVEPTLEVLTRSVTIIPGTTEFGYGTTPVTGTDTGKHLNRISTQPLTDFAHSIEDLLVCAPGLKHVSLVVAWHGTDLRIGNCQIIPKVEHLTMTTAPFSWQVGPLQRGDAQIVSYIEGKPALGGAPSDRTVYEAITFLKSKGLQVTMYPFIMMDVPSGNTLPNPYGGSSQPAYPWRGRITCHPAPDEPGTVDKTAAAATQVDNFFGTVNAAHFSWNAGQQRVNYSGPSNEWSMRRFILHMATIADAAGADDFLIGSELVGLTRIRSDASTFPGVDHLISLLGQVRAKLGSTPKISYAADWSEYHSYRPNDGSNDILFPLDPLWGNANIDYVGIDNYLPMGDWRDGDHLDRNAGYISPYEKDYIQKNVEGGEYFNWYYASTADRNNQVRTPIYDGLTVVSGSTAVEVKAPGQEPDFMDDYTDSDYTFHGQVRFPSSAQDAALATHAGTGYRLWMGVTDEGDTFRLRAGMGAGLLTESTAQTAVLNVPTADLPFDGNLHFVTWEVRLDPGRVRLWIDGVAVGEAHTTTSGPLQTESFSGNGNGTWTEDANGDGDPSNAYAGAPFVPSEPNNDWPSLSGRGNLSVYAGLYNEDWIYRQKDIRGWWTSRHYPRLAGVRQGTPTAWVPKSKQIVFTELGLPAVDKGINQPNVFVDSKSSESFYPYFSNQRPDAAIQRAALEAVLDYWKKNSGGMVNFDKISLWTWDARPYPTFPERADFFGDAGNWQLGHWLTGRLRPGFGFDAGEFGPYAFCDGEEPITRAGITYQPFPISISDITSNGNLDKSDITVTLARGSIFENEFIGFPVSHVVNLIVFQGHTNDAPTLFDYPAIWVGRVGAPVFENETIAFNCVPVSTSIQRPGLRRNYQLSCPHVLFGPQCRASRNDATVTRTVTAISGNTVTFNTALPLAAAKYKGGLLEWAADGHSSIRTIVSVTGTKTGIGIRGNLRGLNVGSSIKITFGCNRLQSDCADLHHNILNFGGQPSIPLENPLSQKNIFY
ncbi:GTA TIM barrel-like domain protein [Rhodobacter phage RcPescado]|nr:GTA TIM barrel-like domain protein [Rhodobacter phage RcPescado]QXN72065.1 GTA TIM barrel-like domain protein [Rhodobacter phage RcPutin]